MFLIVKGVALYSVPLIEPSGIEILSGTGLRCIGEEPLIEPSGIEICIKEFAELSGLTPLIEPSGIEIKQREPKHHTMLSL